MKNLMEKNVNQYEITLNKIQDIQDEESTLIKQLYSNGKINNLNIKNDILNRINNLSDLRVNLLKNMKNLYSMISTNVERTRKDLVNQMAIVGVVENELNNSKNKLNSLTDTKNNKIRMIEINNYYGSKYSSYSDILMIVIYTCLILLVLVFLRKFLPINIVNSLMGIVIGCSIVILFFKMLDINKRDKFNYNKYDWNFDRKNASWYNKNQNASTNKNFGMCFRQNCCGKDTLYDNVLNKCVPILDNTIPQPLNQLKLNNNENFSNY